jgi:ABC-type multidrug transport system fused ATPase/permease subunit
VLRDFSLEIPAGQRIAIIGPSGAGKTSLLHLIPRFFDPASGVVRLDGTDLRTLRLNDLRENVSLAMQEAILLPGSIAENIGYGKPDATQAEIEAAAKSVGAHGFITALPLGYQTVVGDGAARLSTGEKQRIGLARALIKDAPVLLLDEPTSALDTTREAQLLAGLRQRIDGKTLILITHRPEALRLCQRVVWLEAGQARELGTPDEAMKWLAQNSAKLDES